MSQVSIPDEILNSVDCVAEATELKRHQVVQLAVQEFVDNHRAIKLDPYQVAHVQQSFRDKAVNK